MAKIPLPERGQPLDLTYIYQMATAVNDLASQTVSTNYANVDTTTAGKQSVKVNDLKIIAGYKVVTNNSIVNAGNEKQFSYAIPADFKYRPIVTATPETTEDTPAGRDVSVVITSVTTSNIDGIVKFNTAGEASVAINLLIIGIPN